MNRGGEPQARVTQRKSLPTRSLYGILLSVLFLVLYLPYVIRGGLLRDDLGFVALPARFPDYWAFQRYISGFITMTARPVSALLHGISYWYFGTHAFAHHALNLSLFLGSTILVYLAVSRILNPGYALIASGFALAYPAGSGTLFSAIMMNSNLAGFLWAAALYLATATSWSPARQAAITVLLVASGLSYESFLPLFPLVAVVAMLRHPLAKSDGLKAVLPMVLALCLLATYRLIIEPRLFGPTFMRATVPSNIVDRGIDVVISGARVAFIDSVRISFRAFRNLSALGILQWAILGSTLCAMCVAMVNALSTWGSGRTGSTLTWAVCIFVVAHAIFVLSAYSPTAAGFESRTQGAIRFTVGLVLASVFFAITNGGNAVGKKITYVLMPALFALFSLGIVGQREGWIRASEFNQLMLKEMDEVLLHADLAERDTVTVVADVGGGLRGSVNGEPIFGSSWDLGPSLEVAHPPTHFRANVYAAKRTTADSTGVTIGPEWRATFPFYYFRAGEQNLLEVRTEEDWVNAVRR